MKTYLLLTFLVIIKINFTFCRSSSDINLSMDYGGNTNMMPEHFVTLISNEEINEMFRTADGVKQLQAAFLLSVRGNKVSMLYIQKF